MTTNRLEAFSEGVIAIIITIMVLEMKVPRPLSPAALLSGLPVFLSYLLSFVVVGIMWVNHHHLVHMARHPSARVLWANIHLLFWMSLIPWVTGCMGQNSGQPLGVCLYGVVLGFSAAAFMPLRSSIARQHDEPASVRHHRRLQQKNAFSALLYLTGAALAYTTVAASYAIFVAIPAIYFIPDRIVSSTTDKG